ncbi:hypothetical protein GGI05_002385 [Coemansia sp. RSA 2603]|nr:hypothetical protein GGI05_002385 [Coemansia sp. RSA 2603]
MYSAILLHALLPLLLLLLPCTAYAGDGVAAHVTEHWHTQRIDHKRPNSGHFAQRYLMLRQYAQPNGPHIIYLAGERPVVATDLTDTLATVLGEQLGGTLYALEQRFYGASTPNATLSLLSVAQQIADIRAFAQSLPGARRWVLVGASLGGSLAAWTKHVWRDPHVFVVASSAPMRVPRAYWQYDLATAERLPCAGALARAVRMVDGALGSGGRERTEVRGMLGVPAHWDDARVAEAVARPIAEAAQHAQYKTLCRSWETNGGEQHPVAALANLTAPAQQPPGCPAHPAWLWQQCAELGLWQTAPPTEHPFFAHRLRSRLLTLPHYEHVCRCLPHTPPAYMRPVFERFAADARRYLAHRRDVVFTVPLDDPWRYAAVPEGSRARVDVPGAGHGWDVGGGEEVGESVARVREEVVRRVGRWLGSLDRPDDAASPVAVIVRRQAWLVAGVVAALAIYALCRAAAG